MFIALSALLAKLPYASLGGALFGLAAGGAVGLLFKPLLAGLVRALGLLVHPRVTREQLRGRRLMRDAILIRQMIANNTGYGPSHAAELQALAARA